jgi:hypothetical protein
VLQAPLGVAAVRVPVERGGHAVAHERLLVAAAAEEREDLERLPLDRVAHGAVVQHGHLLRGAEPRERRLELERLVERLLDEGLDHGLAPRAERAAAEAAAEALHAGEADAVHLVRVAVEHGDAHVAQRVGDRLGGAALVVVVAEHGYRGERSAPSSFTSTRASSAVP